MRIGTVERNRTVEALEDHAAAGRLDFDEFEERVGQAYAARTAADLARLLVDLPGRTEAEPSREPVSVTPAARRFNWSALGPYLMVNLMMVVIWASSGAGYFWPMWVMGPWGVAILPTILGRSGGRSGCRAAR